MSSFNNRLRKPILLHRRRKAPITARIFKWLQTAVRRRRAA